MHASTVLITLLPACLTTAHFTRQVNQCAGNKNTIGHCETLTFIDRTASTPNAPTPAQCQSTCRDLFTDAGDWIVDFKGQPEGYRQNMLNSACRFSMGRAPGAPRNYQFYMDNQDIADIIDEAVKRFGEGGKVAAEGLVRCDGLEATWYISLLPGASS
ncbi:hypothetical protein ACN47E_001742 [Coniothyrium glycines]